jgi:carbonic anhydrase/acetyltransferase-like protein (isoleucine patch superfamily)
VSIVTFDEQTPRIDQSCFIAPDSWVIGNVQIGAASSIFFGSVLRGDILAIRIGSTCNLQEHVVVHTSHGEVPVTIGNEVTVGHRAILHGGTVGDRCIIGMGATILDGAIIEPDSIVGAHTLVPRGMRIQSGSLAIGTPAKIVRALTEAERTGIVASAQRYKELGEQYKLTLSPTVQP